MDPNGSKQEGRRLPDPRSAELDVPNDLAVDLCDEREGSVHVLHCPDARDDVVGGLPTPSRLEGEALGLERRRTVFGKLESNDH